MINNPFPCSFNDDMERFMQAEDAAEREHTRIESEIAYSMAPGGDCYPYDDGNFHEAVTESNLDSVAALMRSGQFAQASLEMQLIVEEYWLNKARKAAEKC